MSSYIPLAPIYDKLTGDVPYVRFADFYEEIFRRYDYKPESVLDLACGTGTLTLIMARRGYDMIGTDASEEMLAEAMNKMWDEQPEKQVLFLGQPMEELDLYGTVDAAYCSLDGMNYLEPGKIPDVLHRLKLFIQPGGLFVFDINTPEKLRRQDGEIFLDEKDDIFCVWRAAFSEEENACTYGMDIFTRRGKVWDRSNEEHTEYAHTVEFLTDELKKEGFGEISVFGDLSLTPPGEMENRIFIAARRL